MVVCVYLFTLFCCFTFIYLCVYPCELYYFPTHSYSDTFLIYGGDIHRLGGVMNFVQLFDINYTKLCRRGLTGTAYLLSFNVQIIINKNVFHLVVSRKKVLLLLSQKSK